jgi:hypothetical protein
MMRSIRSGLQASVALAAIGAQLALSIAPAGAFCGFYVAKADSKMFNKSLKVVLIRDGQQTAITIASDYEGEPNEFALVVPVPTFIERNQIDVVEPATVDHLDAYTAPRLVEYHDPDPCAPQMVGALPAAPVRAMTKNRGSGDIAYRGVKIEAKYDVAEYDVLILSAKESDGLIAWLNDNGYKIPAGAEPVVGSYIKQKMRFFVAKVNLGRMQQLGRAYLRPLQVRYETAKFMLPLRLGTVNANGPQDLIVFALSKTRPRGSFELPHRQGAVRFRRAAVRQGRLRQLLPRHFRSRGRARENARRVRGICLGYGLVRSLRRRPADCRRTYHAGSRMGRRRWQ